MIYRLYLAHFLEHSARKASFAGDFTYDEILREGEAYAQTLALLMLQENVSKIIVHPRSTLFKEKTVWTKFTGGEPLLHAARSGFLAHDGSGEASETSMVVDYGSSIAGASGLTH